LIGFENPAPISASLPLGVSRFLRGGGAGEEGDDGGNADGRGAAAAGSVFAVGGCGGLENGRGAGAGGGAATLDGSGGFGGV